MHPSVCCAKYRMLQYDSSTIGRVDRQRYREEDFSIFFFFFTVKTVPSGVRATMESVNKRLAGRRGRASLGEAYDLFVCAWLCVSHAVDVCVVRCREWKYFNSLCGCYRVC